MAGFIWLWNQPGGAVVTPHDSIANTNNLSTYAGAATAPPADRLIIAVVVATGATAGNTTISSLSGYGLTWTPIAGPLQLDVSGSVTADAWLYAAYTGASPTSSAFSVTFAAARTSSQFSIFTVEGPPLTGNIADLFVQVVPRFMADGGTASSGTITLAAPADAANRAFALILHEANEPTTAEAGLTEIHDLPVATPNEGFLTMWRPDAFDTSMFASWAGTNLWGGIAFELSMVEVTAVQKNASDGGTAVDTSALATGPIHDQTAFRGRNDDGTEVTATWKAAENTNWTQLVDTNFRVRFAISNTGTASIGNGQLQYNRNGAGWNNVTGASSVVRSSASSMGDVLTTKQLAGGTGAFEAGETDVTNGIASFGSGGLDAGKHTEDEFCVQIRSADVVDADSVQLRVINTTSGVLESYTQTPTITAGVAVAKTASDSAVARDIAIPVNYDTVVLDTFTRSVADGWGTPDIGPAYTGTTTQHDVNGSEGLLNWSSAGDKDAALAVSLTDFEAIGRFRTTDLPTSGGLYWSLLFRWTGATSHFNMGYAVSQSPGTLTLQIARGDTGSPLATALNLGTYTLNDWWRFRLRVVGTALDLKGWKDGTPEPEAWQYSVTSALFAGPGSLVIRQGAFSLPQITSTDDFQVFAAPTAVQKVASDSAVGADTVPTLAKATTDTAVGADTVPILAKAVTDAATAADVSALQAGNLVTASDSAVGADAVTGRAVALTDAAVGTESIPTFAKATTDVATGADVAALAAGNILTANDSATAADAVTGRALSGSDTASGSDAAPAVVDTGLVDGFEDESFQTDAFQSKPTLPGTASITSPLGALTQAATAATNTGVFGSETGTASDVVTGAARATTDTATASDVVATVARPVTDSATAVDVASDLDAALDRTDAATADDDAVLSVPIAVSDAAVGTDTVPALGKTVLDVAVGVDVVSVLDADLDRTDTATAVDASLVGVPLAASDSATAVDTRVLTAALLRTDSATAVDTSALITQLVGTIASTLPALEQAVPSAVLAVPQNLVAVAVSPNEIDLTWDPYVGAVAYDIERDDVVSEDPPEILVFDHPTNAYDDTGLNPNTLYAYRVRAVLPQGVPPLIPGLDFWYEATAITNKADNDPVSQWDDLSGNGKHLVQVTGSMQPIYKPGIRNGNPVVRFDGQDDRLANLSIPARTAHTIFVVLAKRSAVGSPNISSHAFDRGSNAGIGSYPATSPSNWIWIHNQAIANQQVGISAQAWHILVVRVTSASSISFRAEGGAVTATFDPHDSVTTGTQLYLGFAVGQASGDVDIAACIGYDSALHGGNIDAVGQDLAARWGFTWTPVT